ncbi:hypothetical protein A8F94_18525 [Bacillus sp. FJAT-27225]|uniref:hypothetical protein n=1 Tax=Bacillus sp. FJAT-27225 TaxID=1743144 RepID=UPI00080C30C4|nr:hypothetical protein [Bacillus sp. FJAT-27225]OCA83124.1 hypothetical protein A8F94_18525 [Bacillus sp. FJAT-27225]
MITNKLYLYIGIILLAAAMAISFPFPDEQPLGEARESILNMPIRTAEGFSVVGVIGVAMLITGLFFFVNSFRQYKGRVLVISLIMVAAGPHLLANAFQQTFASGIYAIDYKKSGSNCTYEMVNATTLHGECELSFENYSKDEVWFEVEFYENQLVSFMNKGAPYNVSVGPGESTTIKIETDINVSNMRDYAGGSIEVGIIIKSGEKTRRL